LEKKEVENEDDDDEEEEENLGFRTEEKKGYLAGGEERLSSWVIDGDSLSHAI
jgi:hypothetical protein